MVVLNSFCVFRVFCGPTLAGLVIYFQILRRRQGISRRILGKKKGFGYAKPLRNESNCWVVIQKVLSRRNRVGNLFPLFFKIETFEGGAFFIMAGAALLFRGTVRNQDRLHAIFD